MAKQINDAIGIKKAKVQGDLCNGEALTLSQSFVCIKLHSCFSPPYFVFLAANVLMTSFVWEKNKKNPDCRKGSKVCVNDSTKIQGSSAERQR